MSVVPLDVQLFEEEKEKETLTFPIHQCGPGYLQAYRSRFLLAQACAAAQLPSSLGYTSGVLISASAIVPSLFL